MRIDEQFMDEVGLGVMPLDEKQAFMQHAEEELEVRVGQAVGAEMTDEQMAEFEAITDVAEAAAWLDANQPNYREIVERVYGNFKQEIISERNSILGIEE